MITVVAIVILAAFLGALYLLFLGVGWVLSLIHKHSSPPPEPVEGYQEFEVVPSLPLRFDYEPSSRQISDADEEAATFGGSGTPLQDNRLVDVYFLGVNDKDGSLYIRGWCHKSKDYRTFRVSKMTNLIGCRWRGDCSPLEDGEESVYAYLHGVVP